MSIPASVTPSPPATSGRIIACFPASRVIAWGHPELHGACLTTSNTLIYVWKGLAPTFNLFLVVCNAGSDPAEPDMFVIDLQDNVLNRSFGTSALVGYNQDLSSGVCLLFSNVLSAGEFETWMHVALLEAAVERGDIPLTALVAFLDTWA